MRTTIEVKNENIQKHENRVCISALQLSLVKSLICTILKDKEAIKNANVAKGVTVFTMHRLQTFKTF